MGSGSSKLHLESKHSERMKRLGRAAVSKAAKNPLAGKNLRKGAGVGGEAGDAHGYVLVELKDLGLVRRELGRRALGRKGGG